MTKRKQMFDALRPFAPDGEIPARDIPAIDGLADRWELDIKGGFDKAAFLGSFVNKQAPAITDADYAAAAKKLGVPESYIKGVGKVESGPYGGYDNSGRPIILPERHIFHRQTGGRYDRSHPKLSYPRWGSVPYPASFDARWEELAQMAELDENAALESTSWGRYQVMGFHWKSLGHATAHSFVQTIVASEAGHLDSLVGFIRANGLVGKLQSCKPGDAVSCRPFVRGYNGPGYAQNRYDEKLAEAIR